MHLRLPRVCLVLAGSLLCLNPVLLPAQEVTTYQTPSAVLAQFVDAPATPQVVMGPDRTQLLVLDQADRLLLEDLAARELRLAGVRFDPQLAARSRTVPNNGLSFINTRDGTTLQSTGLPNPLAIRDHAWSRDGRHVALVLAVAGRLEPWVVDASSGKARRLADLALHAILGDALTWLDNDTLLARLVPADRGPEPQPPAVPPGPMVQQHDGGRAAARTYADTLSNAHETDLFEYHTTTDLALIGLNGRVTPLNHRAMVVGCLPSPDGRFILVRSYQRPFSFTLPASRFPMRIEVLDRAGARVALVADLPLAESIALAFGSVRGGPRTVVWRADKAAELSWYEALDQGDAEREAGLRDQWMTWSEPFVGEPVVQQRVATRVTSVQWIDATRALLTESWRSTRRTKVWLVDPSRPMAEPKLINDRSTEDRYADPGSPVLTRNEWGRPVIQVADDGVSIFLSGDGASPDGDQPFLDRHNLATGLTVRLWQSQPPSYEEFFAFIEGDTNRLLIRREDRTSPPQYVRLNLATRSSQTLTAFPHPHPAFDAVQYELIRYAREDGVELNGRLYLPPGYNPVRDGPRPTLLWAYPREYLSADAASQVRTSPHRFPRILPNTPMPFVLAGYVVLADPTLPIVGEGRRNRPNDTYVPQLVAGAKAAIDELVRRGVTDRNRVAVGGHSYGAFMTANLLAHTDFFRAGIARSGAYNRTLTPFGFQAESRNFWRAQDVYNTMSPFHNADKIKAPLLLIHGEADENSGTFPIQSDRMYQALKGLGAEARYVVLPLEGHGYRARESLLHMLWETEQWLARHLGPPTP